MTISLYDLSIGSYQQALSGAISVLEKGDAYCQENNRDADELSSLRLYDDMWNLAYQVDSIVHHSVGAVKGLLAGEFVPPKNQQECSYQQLLIMLQEAKQELESFSEKQINECVGKQVIFKIGDNQLPFSAENFIQSFSLPNLYFHATTVYDILRANGVLLGKINYLGKLRIG